MKFEPSKLTKLIEQNYSHIMPDFLEMQTEYLASLNTMYNDLDASLVAMALTSQLYKNTINVCDSKKKFSLKYFYQKENFNLPISDFRIKKISSLLNLPRETVRRKKEKLIKDKLILFDNKNKLYRLNTDLVQLKILNFQIDNLSKFLLKFLVFFNKDSFFTRVVSREQIKRDVEEKFLLYLTKFLDFQISYFSRMKSLIDIESIFILLLCTLNTTTQIKKKAYDKPISSKTIVAKLKPINSTFGLNATSISEITKVPRTTVLRKIAYLEKIGILKKDKHKRYSSHNFHNSEDSKKIISLMDQNIKLLGVFFSQCLETYSSQH